MKSRVLQCARHLVLELVFVTVTSVLTLTCAGITFAATVPQGFTDSLVASGSLLTPCPCARRPNLRPTRGRARHQMVVLSNDILTVTVDFSG